MFRIRGTLSNRYFSRIFSRNSSNISPKVVNQSVNYLDNDRNVRQKERLIFEQSFDRIVEQLTDNEFNNESKVLLNANQWLKTVLEYNVKDGKLNRGLMTVLTYDLLAKPQDKTEQQMESVRALGWALELFQTHFLIIDDIMDNSITRRGKKCWYRQPSVGLMACNDATLIESSIYFLVKQHFKGKPYYMNIIELIHEIFRKTGYGQCMDLLSNHKDSEPDLRSYTFEKYSSIVKYKTSFYSFVLPVRLAMYLTANNSPKDHLLVEQILLKMGHLFQVQDDYLDCFGQPSVTGKIGTDIEDGKCCWNIVTALEVCSEAQRQILQLNYGKNDIKCVSRVKQIYFEIDLQNRFKIYENNMFKHILEMIENFKNQTNIPKSIFDEPLKQIDTRSK